MVMKTIQSRALPSAGPLYQTGHKGDNEDDDKDEKEDFCNSRGRGRNSTETENGRDDGDNQKDDSPFQHLTGSPFFETWVEMAASFVLVKIMRGAVFLQ
jgi:hypothetical protein